MADHRSQEGSDNRSRGGTDLRVIPHLLATGLLIDPELNPLDRSPSANKGDSTEDCPKDRPSPQRGRKDFSKPSARSGANSDKPLLGLRYIHAEKECQQCWKCANP